MIAVTAQDLPDEALIAGYRASGAYLDCFVTTLPLEVSQADYIEAFYCSWLFRLERLVLATLVGKPSSDAQARALALGETGQFAAWSVEARTEDQIVNRDFQGATCSWLMSRREAGATTLYFGTVVTARSGGEPRGGIFRALLGVHQVYARALLRAAAGRLLRRP